MHFRNPQPQLGLGTVQFGVPYGVNANAPLMSESEVQAILQTALKEGIRFFDTAANYGDAEARLGRFGLATRYPATDIATKIPAVSRAVYTDWPSYKTFIRNTVQESLRRLALNKFPLIQFHQCEVDFLTHPSASKAVRYLLEEGFCHAVGISVYSPEEALAAIRIDGVSTLQIPVNLLDRRFLKSEIKTKIQEKRLIARSVFLQGVLIPSSSIPSVTCASQIEMHKLEAMKIASTLGQTLEFLALKFVCTEIKELSVVLLGVDSDRSLKSNLNHYHRMKENTFPEIGKYFADLSAAAEKAQILEPRSWAPARQAA